MWKYSWFHQLFVHLITWIGATGCLMASEVASRTPLRLREDGSFSIIQVADVHTGTGEKRERSLFARHNTYSQR